MRKGMGIVVAFAVGVLVAVPVAQAISGLGHGRLDSQAYVDRATPVSTSSTGFFLIPGLSQTVCAQNEIVATISGNAKGSSFAIEVSIDNDGIMEPGAAYVYPPSTTSFGAFSVTFVSTAFPFENNDHHQYLVLWRSLTGSAATLQRGLFNLQFEDGTHMCP